MVHALDYSSESPTPNRRLVKAAHVVALVYPLLLVAGFYFAWVLAWIVLGHRPRPSLDDPSQVLGAAYFVTALPLGLMPAGAILGLCSVLLQAVRHRVNARVILWTLILVALWTGAIGIMRWDPLQVVYWWFD